MAVNRITGWIITILLTTMLPAAGQDGHPPYGIWWKTVDSLSAGKGLTRSALAEVQRIYTTAKKEKNEAQLIRSLVYESYLEQNITEADSTDFLRWQHEAAAATQPAKSILLSIRAERLYDYYQQRRWEIAAQSPTAGFLQKDPATWSSRDFTDQISALYLASLQDARLLQQTSLASFEPVLIKGNARNLRPTLFDLLAYRALSYFTAGERDLTNPGAFQLNKPDYFLPAKSFTAVSLADGDTAAHLLKALRIYQQLLAFHENDIRPGPWIAADIARLQFVKQQGTVANEDSLFLLRLLEIQRQYPTVPEADYAAYLAAAAYAEKANAWNPLLPQADSNNRYGFQKAAAICRQVVAKPDSSEGKAACFNLLQQLEQATLQLQTEKVNLPGQPFRTLVSYKNLAGLYCRLIALPAEPDPKTDIRNDDNYWQDLSHRTALRSWQQPLPDPGDLQPHRAEIKVDALAAGRYILLTSANADFSLDNNPMAAQYFYVSAISFINSGDAYFILNRENGMPLDGAAVQAWWSVYDYNSRSYRKTKGEKYSADSHGYFRLTGMIRREMLLLDITAGNDRLFLTDGQYSYFRPARPDTGKGKAESYELDEARVFYFTDRSIYRPGQQLFFKGIVTTKDFRSHRNKPLAGHQSTVYLHNANGETLDSVAVTTNSYGSCSGSFLLPRGLLNGNFTILNDDIDGDVTVSVEEYKRPKYAISYDSLMADYAVYDSVRVTGVAKGYAGNSIGGATVSYRVQRVPRFIYSWQAWRGSMDRGGNMEIAHGVTTTNAEGRFTIPFQALPDASISAALLPVFDYRVSADVTDGNGETRSAEITVPIAYQTTRLALSVPASVATDSLRTISIQSSHINGLFRPTLVNVYLYRLHAPDRLIRKRYWETPDAFPLTEAVFVKNFPHDEYRDESDYRNWPREQIYLRKIDSTVSSGHFDLPAAKLPPGWYAAEASTLDKNGDTIKDIAFTLLYDSKTMAVPAPTYTWTVDKTGPLQPGELGSITTGTTLPRFFLIRETDKKEFTQPRYTFDTVVNSTTATFRASDSDRGGYWVTDLYVADNRFYSQRHFIDIPWTNKPLAVTLGSFRDKTLPGSTEKWTVNISGREKDRVAAELLASMYDASLDQFKPHQWAVPGIWENYTATRSWEGANNFEAVQAQQKLVNLPVTYFQQIYDALITEKLGRTRFYRPGMVQDMAFSVPAPAPGTDKNESVSDKLAGHVAGIQVKSKALDEVVVAGYGTTRPAAPAASVTVPTRKNFAETAFFYPALHTDSSGNVSFSFTLPEAVTQWKFQALAHTADLSFGYRSASLTTQKPVMVQPGTPRFLREGDHLELSASVVNLTDSEQTGTVELTLFNTATNEPVDGWFNNIAPTQFFTAAAHGHATVKFSIAVPFEYNSAVTYRFVVSSGNNSDGEEASLPVLTNRMLVTESMPLPFRGKSPKSFRFDKLLQSGNSETLQQYGLTVEFTGNPAWYAVQALPYLMEYPWECAEQTFNRYYANALAAKITGSSPPIKSIIERWQKSETAALVSPLQKNEDLKNVLLEETPWVVQAESENKQKKNIARLFDSARLNSEMSASFAKIMRLQSSNGGFVWFTGGPEDRYMTQYVLSGLGHLQHLGALQPQWLAAWEPILKSAVAYCDQRIKEDYDDLLKRHLSQASSISATAVQYLYMRSFFSRYNLPGASFGAVNYFRGQAQRSWLKQPPYLQGMIALALYRSGDLKTAKDIMKSLQQNAVRNDEMGMYWKNSGGGYYWQESPVETQSLLVEAFAEIVKDNALTDDCKTWLLKQKQTNNWSTTRATAEACYALLLQGSNWLAQTPEATITLGSKTISSKDKAESGTGYFVDHIAGPFVKPAMGEITVRVASAKPPAVNGPAWGAVYWQYFEDLDKITPAATPLSLEKQLFRSVNTDRGPELQPVKDREEVHTGDKIMVRIVLRSDRDMEYVHMKDMRASCLEPVNVLSGYRYQGGLGYYESTKDASTNFFFPRIAKGTYVFEYPLFVTHAGDFSNGISTVQCMYAPEFSAHSSGIRLSAVAADLP